MVTRRSGSRTGSRTRRRPRHGRLTLDVPPARSPPWWRRPGSARRSPGAGRLAPPVTSRVLVGDRDVPPACRARRPDRLRAHRGALLPQLAVRRNIEYGQRKRDGSTRSPTTRRHSSRPGSSWRSPSPCCHSRISDAQRFRVALAERRPACPRCWWWTLPAGQRATARLGDLMPRLSPPDAPGVAVLVCTADPATLAEIPRYATELVTEPSEAARSRPAAPMSRRTLLRAAAAGATALAAGCSGGTRSVQVRSRSGATSELDRLPRGRRRLPGPGAGDSAPADDIDTFLRARRLAGDQPGRGDPAAPDLVTEYAQRGLAQPRLHPSARLRHARRAERSADDRGDATACTRSRRRTSRWSGTCPRCCPRHRPPGTNCCPADQGARRARSDARRPGAPRHRRRGRLRC